MSDEGPEYNIAVKSPGGQWEKLGAGALSDVIPENIVHTHGPRGPEQLSFTLKRDSRVYLPDELPFTEVATTVGGVPAWSGRLMRAPRSRGLESLVNPVAEGWMTSHLQDYPIDKTWVLTDPDGFVDCRSLPASDLMTVFRANGTVAMGGGRITLAYPQGAPIQSGSHLGVRFDLGPNSAAYSVCFDYATSNNTAGITWHVLGSNNGNYLSPVNLPGASMVQLNASPSGRTGGTFASPYRYIYLLIYTPAGFTPGAEVCATFSNVLVSTAANPADHLTGYNSSLKASKVITDTLATCPKLSADLSGIAASSFSIPSYSTGGRRAPADIVNDVNAYHQWQLFGTPDPLPRPIYRPVPTTPTWIISEDSAYEYDDAGANEGAEIVDTCILQYTDASGAPMEYIATATGTILSRVGYSRAKVLQARSRLTPAAAQQIAQAYVAAHQSSPFKGKVRLRGTATRYADGAQIPVGLMTYGDAVVLGSETNPETGAPGRIGIIQKITYTHDQLMVEIELDSSRNYLDSVLSRLAIVVR